MVYSGPCQWNGPDRCSSHDLRLFAVLFKLIKLAGLSYKRYSKKNADRSNYLCNGLYLPNYSVLTAGFFSFIEISN